MGRKNDIFIHMTDSLCCVPETSTTMLGQLYSNTPKFFKKLDYLPEFKYQ